MTNKTYRELLAERETLEAQIEAVKGHERQGVITQIKELMADYEISFNELVNKKPSKSGHSVAPKYRDPQSGSTWSGRGKPPRWLAGQNRDAFLIVPKENA